MDNSNWNMKTQLMRAINTMRIVNCARQTVFVLSLAMLPIAVQAASQQRSHQTYVIATYGGAALLPAVRQQLSSSRDGGSVTTYQDNLVLQTTAANYQAIQQLLTQIDRQPQTLTVAVRVGNNSSIEGNSQQAQVIISNRGIQGAGVLNQYNSQQQSSQLYQVQTLSGSAASISTGTLYALTQTYNANLYPSYHKPSAQIVIQQQVLLPTSQGITVTPRLLANGHIEVTLSQLEEALVRSKPSYNNHGYNDNAVQGQRLNSTIIVPRGQWITIGQISQHGQTQQADYGSNRTLSKSNSVPIALLVQ